MYPLYHKFGYMSSDYRQGLKPNTPYPISEDRGLRRAKAHGSIMSAFHTAIPTGMKRDLEMPLIYEAEALNSQCSYYNS
jgi:hypothetical protein